MLFFHRLFRTTHRTFQTKASYLLTVFLPVYRTPWTTDGSFNFLEFAGAAIFNFPPLFVAAKQPDPSAPPKRAFVHGGRRWSSTGVTGLDRDASIDKVDDVVKKQNKKVKKPGNEGR